MTTESVPTGLWSADDVEELTEMLAARRSRLWQLTQPADLAAWVFADPEPAPLDSAPAALDGHWADGLDEPQRAAWALAGWVARMTVPDAAPTAGRHWLLSRVNEGHGPLLRLTVGVLETLGVYESGEEVWLRVAGAPVVHAMDAGAADLEEWGRRGIDMQEDRTKTLAEEKLLLTCPDIDTALWLLRQPPVMAAARMLNAWVAAGPFPFQSRYRAEVAGRAWQAAETLLAGAPPAETGARGFDREYAGPAVPADLPAQRSFDAAAYRAGVSEHDRLCRALINHLTAEGVRVGAGLHGVPVDLAWRDADGRQFIAEVKSLVGDNEIEQLRLGLGQVLEYRHRLAARGVVATPVLFVSRCTDRSWPAICRDNGVILLQGQGDSEWMAALTKVHRPGAAPIRPSSPD
ncbi:hypothetical protein D7147_08140 [Micromonospora musae]|uniref:DUF91 domain-containing protein n=1 Tax=Micromonospora musae TaxID=1894970 RepID=A0ABX9RFY0_9ACTN|nr:hypothetical protein [Micromonospora musae]RKN22604.1 hypothetical protein D7147_08140 [Micromonospora musae]